MKAIEISEKNLGVNDNNNPVITKRMKSLLAINVLNQ